MPVATARYKKVKPKSSSKSKKSKSKPRSKTGSKAKKYVSTVRRSADAKPGPGDSVQAHENYLLQSGYKRIGSYNKKVKLNIMMRGKISSQQVVPEFYKIMKPPKGRPTLKNVSLAAVVKVKGETFRGYTFRTVEVAMEQGIIPKTSSGAVKRTIRSRAKTLKRKTSKSKSSRKTGTVKKSSKAKKPSKKTSSKKKTSSRKTKRTPRR